MTKDIPISVGVYRQEKDELDSLPFPKANIYPHDEKETWIKLLTLAEGQAKLYTCNAPHICRICGASLDKDFYLLDVEGEMFYWPKAYMHYIKEHNVKIHKGFYKLLREKFKFNLNVKGGSGKYLNVFSKDRSVNNFGEFFLQFMQDICESNATVVEGKIEVNVVTSNLSNKTFKLQFKDDAFSFDVK